MGLYRKSQDLLSLSDLNDTELGEIISFARELKSRHESGEELQLLTGVQLFLFDPDHLLPAWNPFRLGLEQLGGRAHEIDPGRINLNWSETYLDLFAQLDRIGHGLAMSSIRSGEGQGFIQDTAELMSRPVLNMLSDDEAPFQALASLMTLEERRGGDLSGCNVALCWAPQGLIPKPASLATSLAEILIRRDADLRLACPPEFHPGQEFAERMDQLVPGAVQLAADPAEAMADADVVFSFNWAPASAGDDYEALRQESERHGGWRLEAERFELAAPGALLGGSLPQGRGIELAAELLELPQAMHLEESSNLLHVVKAVLALTLDLCQEQPEENEPIQ